MCRLAKVEYESEVQHSIELHTEIANEKAKKKYAKHYNSCKDVSRFQSFVSFALDSQVQ